jgi:anion-transporting  ArsA/GET3 family ATPase
MSRQGPCLNIVTGKGGVGKTTLAAALAQASAAQGANTVLVTLDTRDSRHPVYDAPLEYQPHQVAPRLAVSRVDAFRAVSEYVRRKMPFAPLAQGFFRSRTFREFAAAAPGFEELMCLGKLYDLATGGDYDRVVFDAPATGHLRLLLEVPDVTLRTVQVGPLNHNARKIRDLLLDPERTHVHVVALPEEMAIREALELRAYCAEERRMGVGRVLVNRCVSQRFTAAESAAMQVAAAEDAEGVLAVAVAAYDLAELQTRTLDLLQGVRVLQIPRVVGPTAEPRMLVDRLAELLGPVVRGKA